MNDDMITLRELRKAHGYSLRKVASCAGLSASELSRVEVGERGLSGAARMRRVNLFNLIAIEYRPEWRRSNEGI